jgi:hypothetical protein
MNKLTSFDIRSAYCITWRSHNQKQLRGDTRRTRRVSRRKAEKKLCVFAFFAPLRQKLTHIAQILRSNTVVRSIVKRRLRNTHYATTHHLHSPSLTLYLPSPPAVQAVDLTTARPTFATAKMCAIFVV